MTVTPPAPERPSVPPTDRVIGPRRKFSDLLASHRNVETRLLGAPFVKLDSRWRIDDAIEGGAGATFPLLLVHGFFALYGLFNGKWDTLMQHGSLTVLAVVAYQAIRRGRTVWPACMILGWLLAEIAFGPSIFGYQMGRTTLNMIGVPLAILAVRAGLKRSRLSRQASVSP